VVAATDACIELILDDLDEGNNRFTFAIAADALELEHDFFSFFGTVDTEVEIRRSMDNFFLEGRVDCQLEGDCYRCLEKMQEPFKATFHLLLQRRRASTDELESAEEDGFIEIVDPGTRQIDLAQYIREAIVLELPMRIPSEVNDGVCPHCGKESAKTGGKKDAKSDSRWDVLKNLEFSPKH
jgi:uncharacterized protein